MLRVETPGKRRSMDGGHEEEEERAGRPSTCGTGVLPAAAFFQAVHAGSSLVLLDQDVLQQLLLPPFLLPEPGLRLPPSFQQGVVLHLQRPVLLLDLLHPALQLLPGSSAGLQLQLLVLQPEDAEPEDPFGFFHFKKLQ